MEHVKSPVIQSQDFYPFGLAFNSYSRENSLSNQYKFQGQEHQDELDLGWDSFKWRNHIPEIGRFFNVDPLSEKYYYNSPYAFSENKVTSFVELEGLEGKSIHEQAFDNELNKLKGVWDSFVNKVEQVIDKITPDKQVGKTDIEAKNTTPIATDEEQREQITPTNTPSDMDGTLNPLYNPNATVDSKDTDGDKVMTSSESHQKATSSSNQTDIQVDSITIGGYHFRGSLPDSTTDHGDYVKVNGDTVPVYRFSTNNFTGKKSVKSDGGKVPMKPYLGNH